MTEPSFTIHRRPGWGQDLVVSGARTVRQAAEKSRANLSGANLSGANLSRANLSRADLSGANLSGANLSGANLSRANLSGANLSGANLYGANLYGADLYGANLYGANLSGADLYGANLSRADLSGADLSGANLYGANLSGADLSGANLSGANLYGANLSGADLSGANLYGANPSGADLSRADLSGANLYGANLSREQLRPFRADVWITLTEAQDKNEVRFLIAALKAGAVDGETYGEGKDCACLVGTLARFGGLGGEARDRNADRPAERWFMMIRPGDVPGRLGEDGKETGGGYAARMALDWALAWCEATGTDPEFPRDLQIPPLLGVEAA